MATINWQTPICRVEQINPGDLLAIWSQNNGDTRKMSLSQFTQWLQSVFASPDFATQFVVPGTGFNVAVSYNGSNVWVLLQPASGLATGTITLPLASSTADGTEVLVTTTQQVSALTTGANGATAVYGAPSSLGADDVFKLRFYQPTNSWYKVQ
jgi:hypothetical protein